MESIAFKEWAIVCEALGRGVQSIILRKGGIAEGREGFAFRHREFFLFPTFFHEQIEKTRLGDVTLPERREGEIELRFLAKLEIAKWITSPEIAESLEPLHILKPEVVQERFQYDDVAGFARGLRSHLPATACLDSRRREIIRGLSFVGKPARAGIGTQFSTGPE